MRVCWGGAVLAVLLGCSMDPSPTLPPVDSPDFDEAILARSHAHHDPVQHRCEYSNVGGSRMWEHVDVVGNDGTYYTIDYPNREREMAGRRRGMMQEKRVPIDLHTISPCSENMFTPTAEPAGPPKR